MTPETPDNPPADPTPDLLPAPVPEPEKSFFRQIIIAAMGLLIVALAIWLLEKFAVILQQLLVAVFIVYLILPIRRWLGQRFSALISYIIIIIGLLVICFLFGLMIEKSLGDLTDKLPTYKANVNKLIKQPAKWFPGMDEKALRRIIFNDVSGVDAGASALHAFVGTFFGLLGQAVVVLVYTAFLLAEQVSTRRRIESAFAPERAQALLDLTNRINTSISNYIAVKTFVSFLTGLSTTITLLIFQVDYAVVWGIIAFLFNYIPYIGSAVAIFFPSLLALAQFGDIWFAVLIFVLLNGVQCLIGYWLEPVLTGQRLNLSPLVLIVSLAFWGSIWGIVGMILAVPLVVSIKIILENIPDTRPLGMMLAHYGKKSDKKDGSA